MLGGHEHVYLYRKFNNSVVLKSGVNFKTFSEITLSFRKSSELKWKVKMQNNPFQKFHAKNGVEEDGEEGHPDDRNYMLNYKTDGVSQDSYKSEFFYNGDKMTPKMSFFPGEIINTVNNQFGRRIQIDVQRHDIRDTNSTKFLKKTRSFVNMKNHVDELVEEIQEKGKEPLFYLMRDMDLTSNSVRSKENNMANWIARLIQIESGADLVFLHGGNIRSMHAYSSGHTLTLMDINKMTAIVDHYEFVSATGRTLVQILENGYRGAPNPLGCFIHSAGLNVVLDISKEYNLDQVMNTQNDIFAGRVSRVEMDEGTFDMEREYVLAAQHFIVDGGDGFHAFKNTKSLGVKDKIITNNAEITQLARLAKKEEFRKEFLLFKKFLCGRVRDSDMRQVQRQKDFYFIDPLSSKIKLDSSIRIQNLEKKKMLTTELLEQFRLVSNFSKKSFLEMLNVLQVSCLKRLRKYKLVAGIRDLGECKVFEIDPKFYSKVVYK